jgi:ornithine carbamoyltransferase
MLKHYLDFNSLSAEEIADLLRRAIARKVQVKRGERPPTLASRALLMIFEKASTRTRASFSAAMSQAGGQAQVFDLAQSQRARGESIADMARSISSMFDAVMIRANHHATIEEFAAHSACPVINGLSDRSHPCQVLADVMTFEELRGSLAGRKIAWIGDCNNVFFSWAQAADILGATLVVACPASYRFDETPAGVTITDLDTAVDGAALVMTDVWVSMGDEDAHARQAAFAGYCVNAELMARAEKDALFMHCLPAHRGEEVAAEVIDGPHSVVWQQAENRLHAQKALLEKLLGTED